MKSGKGLLIQAMLMLCFYANAQTTLQQTAYFEQETLIKERMLRNRSAISYTQIQQAQNQRAITYIPIAFTIVGTSEGKNYTPVQPVIEQLCALNDIFLDQDIQFYLKDEIYYMNEDYVYNNPDIYMSRQLMQQQKQSDCINVFISPAVFGPQNSFFDESEQLIMLSQVDLLENSTTLAHEMGHYFSLVNTSYGWGWNAYQLNTTPDAQNIHFDGTIVDVERVVRSGNDANCATAGDGFCDTPADYFNFVTINTNNIELECPYAITDAFDPLGALLAPNTANIMSSFECRSTFSDAQKDAITADLIQRGWDQLNLPANAGSQLNITFFNTNYPATNDLIDISGALNITWEAATGASGYHILLTKVINASTEVIIVDQTVYNSTQLSISEAFFDEDSEYQLEIYPFALYNTCIGAVPAQTTFYTDNLSSSKRLQAEFETNWQAHINQNILEVQLQPQVSTTSVLCLYNMAGQKLKESAHQNLIAGKHTTYMDVSDLPSGNYVLTWRTNTGIFSTLCIK